MIVFLCIAVCLLISGLFSGMEAGILSVNRVRLRYMAKLREPAAIRLCRLLSHPERILVTVLLVTNFMNICAVALGTRALAHWLGPWGYLVAFVVWLPVWLGVELLPKSIFRRVPYRALAFFSGALRLAGLLLSPLLGIGSAIYNSFLSHREHGFKKIFTAREDFKYIVAENERTGSLGKTEGAMINHIIDFHGIMARDVMRPVAEAHCIPENATVDELVKIGRDSHFEQFPVVGQKGEVVGVVNLFEVLLDIRRGSGKVAAYVRRIVTVPPEEPAFNVIRKLRAARGSLAVVLDTKAGAVGVISSDTLIRRLIGTA
jgi:putative hemolysin